MRVAANATPRRGDFCILKSRHGWHKNGTKDAASSHHLDQRAAGGADAPIYARVNVTIPKPKSYYWEPMRLMWL